MPDLPFRASRKKRPRSTKGRRRRVLESLEPRCLLASLAGEVFVDEDFDGLRGPAEVVVPDAQVYLDSNDNGQLDISEVSTVTDLLGQYSFDNLAPGSYVVRLLTPGCRADESNGVLWYGVSRRRKRGWDQPDATL